MQPVATKTTVHMVEIRRYRKAASSKTRDRHGRDFVLDTQVVFISATNAGKAKLQVQESYEAESYEVSVVGDIDTIDRKVSDLKKALHEAAVRRNVWLKRRGQLLRELGEWT